MNLNWKKVCSITGLTVMAAALLGAQVVRVEIAPEKVLKHFAPNQALGAGVDRISVEAINKTLTPEMIKKVQETGWGPISYRQNTELTAEAWHWNPRGDWSDKRGRGYFTGSSEPGKPIQYSYGYWLPRRGFTRNDGTGNSGYSMLTDGDLKTYWKSNPYLSKRFTGEEDTLHPQWIVVDLKNKEHVNALRIEWAEPYAKKYVIQMWTGSDPMGEPNQGVWKTLPMGEVTSGKGGTVVVRFAHEAMNLRFLRVLMTESSNTCNDDGPDDPRNCVGYAVREIYLGTQTADGKFHDDVRHTPDQDQTTTYSSSVDPWHEKSDLRNTKHAQVGFDKFFTSGVTNGLPAMVPIAMIYSQPEDAVAQMKYLEARQYPVSYVEMGEEVDGQFMSPEDYAALYIQFAHAIHEYDPKLKLGGPAFQGVNEDIVTWPDAEGRASWLERFLDYLQEHGAIKELAFFSFEHYPYDQCKFSWNALYDEPHLIAHILDVWKDDGLPDGIPMFVTEGNLSSGASESYFNIFSALWLADYAGSFLSTGGDALYFFHYLPLRSYNGCNNSPGNFGMFTVDENFKIKQPLAQFFASQMITREWLKPGGEEHLLYPASPTWADGAGHELVTAYAVERPDKQWSVMLVNRDQENDHAVHIVFDPGVKGKVRGFTGELKESVFGKAQYAWHPESVLTTAHPDDESQAEYTSKHVEGYAEPDGPILHKTIEASSTSEFQIPAASIVVLTGQLTVVDEE